MTVGPAQFAFLRGLLQKRTGVVIDESKAYLVVARLTPIVRQRGIAGIDALIDRLRAPGDASVERDVLNAMMTHETSFFRDKSPFETLKKLIPEIVARRGAQKQLSIWSAACSSGQEPYSIAMLLNEHFPDLVASWNIRILATDISENVLTLAREGAYSQWEMARGLTQPMVARYFRPLRGKWSIVQECRRFVEFRRMNLNDPWPMMPHFDVVFLRNVMLYFAVPTRASIVGRMRRVLKPDGGLFLGGAETLLGVDDGYERIAGVGCGFYRPKPAGPVARRR